MIHKGNMTMYIASTKIVNALDSLVASTEVATFEVDKLQTPLGSFRWRSTASTASVHGKLDTTRTLKAWGVLYNNAQTGDTVRLRLANTEADLTASPVLDTGTVSAWPGTGDLSGWDYIHTVKRIAAASQVAALWFRIDFSFTAFVEAGALILDDSIFDPALGQEADSELEDEPRAAYDVEFSAGGLGRGGGGNKRNVNFRFLGLTKDEALGDLKSISRDRNVTKPVVAVLDETEDTYPMDYIYYGYMGTNDFLARDKGTRFEVEVRITEP